MNSYSLILTHDFQMPGVGPSSSLNKRFVISARDIRFVGTSNHRFHLPAFESAVSRAALLIEGSAVQAKLCSLNVYIS